MKSAFALAAVIALSAAAITPSLAESPREGPREGLGRMFEKADANGDGKVSAAEFSASSTERAAAFFAKLDADGDGFLTMEELKEARKYHRGPRGEHGPRGDRPPME